MATSKKTTTPAAKKTSAVAAPVIRKDVYVAFSIAGTKTFITASLKQQAQKQIEELLEAKKPGEPSLFSLVKSRRPGFDDSKEIKLSFSLLNNKDGTPTKSKIKVLQAFKTLEDMGWTIDRAAFVKYHWSK